MCAHQNNWIPRWVRGIIIPFIIKENPRNSKFKKRQFYFTYNIKKLIEITKTSTFGLPLHVAEYYYFNIL